MTLELLAIIYTKMERQYRIHSMLNSHCVRVTALDEALFLESSLRRFVVEYQIKIQVFYEMSL